MRKFYTLLLLALFALTGTLQARNLDQAVERAVTARTEQAKTRPTHSKAQKTPSQDIQTWYKLPVISWQQYEQLSQQAVQKWEKLANLYTQMSSSYMEKGFQEEDADVEVKQGLPVYEQAVKNFPYVYIGEYHNTPVVQQEIKKLLKAVRQANPGKKILLATEFLQTSHPLISPLHKDGQQWLITEGLTNYDIPALADELHIDTLALDDNIIQIVGSVSLLKVGDRYIKVSLASNPKARSLIAPFKEEIKTASRMLQEDTLGVTFNYLLQPAQIENYIVKLFKRDEFKEIEVKTLWTGALAHQFGPDNVKYVEALTELQDSKLSPLTPQQVNAVASAVYLLNSIQASTWGVLQRNYQWAKSIKEVEKNYDIVIVWGGQGHFDDDYLTPSVPMLLNHPDAVIFAFSPIDMFDATDEDSLKREIKRQDKLLQQKLSTCSNSAVDPEKATQFFEACQLLDTVDIEQTNFFHTAVKKPSTEIEAAFSPEQKALLNQIRQLNPADDMTDDFKSFYLINLR